jgi:hypothetical protein
MPTAHDLGLGTRPSIRSMVFGVVSVLAYIGAAAGQELSSAKVIGVPLEVPRGSAKAGFELARLNTENYGAFEPFYVRNTEPLGTALGEGRVAPDTRLLVTETAAGSLALLTDQMAYHHLAQGREGGKDWMATF